MLDARRGLRAAEIPDGGFAHGLLIAHPFELPFIVGEVIDQSAEIGCVARSGKI